MARQSGQDGQPIVRWSRSTAATYQRRSDVLTIGREFAQRWASDSPEARYIIAHEFGHRAGNSTTAELLRAAISWRSAVVLILGSATMSALLALAKRHRRPGGHPVRRGRRHRDPVPAAATRRPALFAADDYATATVGRDGVDVLATMTVPTGFHRHFATHPNEVERLRRQGAEPIPGQRP